MKTFYRGNQGPVQNYKASTDSLEFKSNIGVKNNVPSYSSVERQQTYEQRMSATAEAIDNLKRLSDSIKMKI